MKTVKTFSNELEANLARIALEAAGVQVLVPEHCVEAALKVLDSPTR